MTIIDRWMHAHRLSRAVFLVVALGGLLLWMLWDPPPERISRVIQTGQVVAVAEGGVTLIALPDGKQVRALSIQPAANPGDRLPMIVETYADGSVTAMVDSLAWATAAPNR